MHTINLRLIEYQIESFHAFFGKKQAGAAQKNCLTNICTQSPAMWVKDQEDKEAGDRAQAAVKKTTGKYKERSQGNKKAEKAKTSAAKGSGTEADAGGKARWTMTTKPKYGDEGWNEAGRKFYTKVHEAMRGINFKEEEWVDVWKEFLEEEKNNHIKKGEKKSMDADAAEEEDVDVEALWDDEDMDGMNEQWDSDELDSFEVTQISGAS